VEYLNTEVVAIGEGRIKSQGGVIPLGKKPFHSNPAKSRKAEKRLFGRCNFPELAPAEKIGLSASQGGKPGTKEAAHHRRQKKGSSRLSNVTTKGENEGSERKVKNRGSAR